MSQNQYQHRSRLASPAATFAVPAFVVVYIAVFGAFVGRHGRADLASLTKTTLFSGVAMMLLIETVKRLTPLRAWFQSRVVYSMLVAAIPPILSAPGSGKREDEAVLKDLTDATRRAVERTIGDLGSASLRGSFNLPVEQLMPQLSDALSNEWVRQSDEVPALMMNRPSAMNLLDVLVGADFLRKHIENGPNKEELEIRSEIIERRAGLLLERMQTEIGNLWRHYIRVTATCGAGIIGLVIAAASPADVAISWATPLAALAGGGFVAWFARDLTAVIERQRR